MTPQERAEKFYDLIFGSGAIHTGKVPLGTIFKNEFMAHIEEAQKEAVLEMKLGWDETTKEEMETRYAEGFHAARDKARGIAEKSSDPDFIALRIGEMEMGK